MKKLYTFLAVAGYACMAHAQSLSPTVIASTGGFSQNANGSLSYTVGEMTMVQTFSANGNILTQGFQQPNDVVSGLIDLSQTDFGAVIVYPNPAVDNLWYGFQYPESGRLEVTLFNTVGQKVADLYSGNYSQGKQVEELNVSTYAAGMYMLTVNFVSATDGRLHTTTRKFQVIN